jgi:hypothetical protein
MVSTLNCAQVQSHLDEYYCQRVERRAAPGEDASRGSPLLHAIEGHLGECAACRAALDQLTAVSDRLRSLAASVQPPAGLSARIKRRVAKMEESRRARRRAFALGGLAALVAALILVPVVHLYSLLAAMARKIDSRQPPPPPQRIEQDGHPVAADYLAVAANYRYESLTRQLKLVPDLLRAGEFPGKKNYIEGTTALIADQEALGDELVQALARKGRTAEAPCRFEAAVLLHGVEIRRRWKGVTIVPVNATPYPETREEEAKDEGVKQAVAYSYAALAVHHLRELFRTPVDAEAGSGKSLVVKVDLETLTKGRVSFSLGGPDEKAAVGTFAFADSAAPIPLFWHFTRADEGALHAPGGPSGDEVQFRFDRSGERRVVSLVTHDPRGIDLGGHFGMVRAAELCFEARGGFSGGVAPEVQFSTGGKHFGAVGAPPGRLDSRWKRFSIPVDLGQARSWYVGLTVSVTPPPGGGEVTVSVRNAYIRPLGVRPSGTVVPGAGGHTAGKDEAGKRLLIYKAKKSDPYVPAGIMPDGNGVAQDQEFWEGESGRYCYRAKYILREHPWVGVSFLLDRSWKPKRRFDVFKAIGARRGDRVVARVRARSPDGATVRFKVGGGEGDSLLFPAQSGWIRLSRQFQVYEIDLTGADLSDLRIGLTWVMERSGQPKGKDEVTMIIEEAYIVKARAKGDAEA